MKINLGRLQIALFRWTLPISFIGFQPRPKEYGIDIAISKLFQFWIALDFNKYDTNGYMVYDNDSQKHL